MARWFRGETGTPASPSRDEIFRARQKLGDLGTTLADLNRKIERLEKITARWRERERSGQI